MNTRFFNAFTILETHINVLQEVTSTGSPEFEAQLVDDGVLPFWLLDGTFPAHDLVKPYVQSWKDLDLYSPYDPGAGSMFLLDQVVFVRLPDMNKVDIYYFYDEPTKGWVRLPTPWWEVPE